MTGHSRRLPAILMFSRNPGTAEGDRFDVLATLIEDYERKALAHRSGRIPWMPSVSGWSRQASVKPIWRRSWVHGQGPSEIMRRKRSLTMEQALKLHEEWHIPAEALLRPSA